MYTKDNNIGTMLCYGALHTLIYSHPTSCPSTHTPASCVLRLCVRSHATQRLDRCEHAGGCCFRVVLRKVWVLIMDDSEVSPSYFSHYIIYHSYLPYLPSFLLSFFLPPPLLSQIPKDGITNNGRLRCDMQSRRRSFWGCVEGGGP